MSRSPARGRIGNLCKESTTVRCRGQRTATSSGQHISRLNPPPDDLSGRDTRAPSSARGGSHASYRLLAHPPRLRREPPQGFPRGQPRRTLATQHRAGAARPPGKPVLRRQPGTSRRPASPDAGCIERHEPSRRRFVSISAAVLGVLVGCLTREPCDHVGGQRQTGNSSARIGSTSSELLGRVGPPHRRENRVATTLERHVQMLAYSGRRPEHIQKPLGEIGRLDTREAKAGDSRPRDGFNKASQICTRSQYRGSGRC